MFFAISHSTSYTFSIPVFLEPHLFRFWPRTDSSQRLLSFQLTIDPKPSGYSDILDSEGNIVRWVWFNDTTQNLNIEMQCEVSTQRKNPYDYIITTPSFQSYPFQYQEEILPSLHSYLNLDKNMIGKKVENLSDQLLKKSGGDIFAFLDMTNTFLYENWQVIVREKGQPLNPEETMQQNKASCRDMALLLMALYRNAGIASRFVSGYQEGDPDTLKRQLHAWVEVYIPGGGWRGYDPTHGLAVSDRHVALAASWTPREAAPCTGKFRGTGAKASMAFTIELRSKSND